MGLFGGGRKAAERAAQEELDRQRNATNAEVDRLGKSGVLEMDGWLDRLQTLRPSESVALTDDLLAEAGPAPFPSFTPGFPDHGVIRVRSMVKAYGAAVADRRKIDTFNGGDRNLSEFWQSVSNYLGSLRSY